MYSLEAKWLETVAVRDLKSIDKGSYQMCTKLSINPESRRTWAALICGVAQIDGNNPRSNILFYKLESNWKRTAVAILVEHLSAVLFLFVFYILFVFPVCVLLVQIFVIMQNKIFFLFLNL
jgi:hypothetical protein